MLVVIVDNVKVHSSISAAALMMRLAFWLRLIRTRLPDPDSREFEGRAEPRTLQALGLNRKLRRNRLAKR